MKDIRDIILNLFDLKYENNDLKYSTQLKAVFDSIPSTFKNVPLFTDEESLHNVLTLHFLNEDGLLVDSNYHNSWSITHIYKQAIKRILWVFRKSFPRLEYCPMLAPTISLLLVFLSEAEAYCAAHYMLEESTKLLDERGQYLAEEMRAMRWHFTTRLEEFEK